MPQFDFTTYSSQIFWFLLCFSVLYCFLARVILPRIRDIVKNRQSVIGKDVEAFNKLEAEIAEIKAKSADLMEQAEIGYRHQIEKASGRAAENKNEFLRKFKTDSEKILEKSKLEIAALRKDSESKADKMVLDLSEIVKKKVLN